jgi:hypothetical protein
MAEAPGGGYRVCLRLPEACVENGLICRYLD